jgi:hypothetical protein
MPLMALVWQLITAIPLGFGYDVKTLMLYCNVSVFAFGKAFESKNYQTYNAFVQKYFLYTIYLIYAIMPMFDVQLNHCMIEPGGRVPWGRKHL